MFTCPSPVPRVCRENDLVLLAKERPAGGAVVREVGAVHALGMVESLRRDRAWVRLCLADHTHQARERREWGGG